VEVLISDRHSLDDTVDVIRQQYGNDPRFRFFKEADGIGWVENFNFLLHQARGKYFTCMAHDDSFPPAFIDELVSVLEERDDAALAFGRVEQVSMDGFLPTFPFTPPPVSDRDPWTIGCSLRLLTLWQLWIAYRGMVRRDIIERYGLYMRQTHRSIRADVYWVFALSLCGRVCYVPSCSYTKHFYRSSTGADWSFGIRQGIDAFRTLRSYLNDYVASKGDALAAQFVVFLWCMIQGILPAKVGRQLGIITRRVLLSRRYGQ
jgi:GT2 family glycosyltransferase